MRRSVPDSSRWVAKQWREVCGVTGLPWGGLLSREGRQYMEQAPWLALWPGLCLTLVVSSLNLFGDAIRDLLDPRLKGGLGRLGAGM